LSAGGELRRRVDGGAALSDSRLAPGILQDGFDDQATAAIAAPAARQDRWQLGQAPVATVRIVELLGNLVPGLHRLVSGKQAVLVGWVPVWLAAAGAGLIR